MLDKGGVEVKDIRLVGLPLLQPDSKLKKLLSDGAERTADALWNLRGSILDQFSNEECATTSNIADTATIKSDPL